jgi:hypothetical protein
MKLVPQTRIDYIVGVPHVTSAEGFTVVHTEDFIAIR